MILTVTLSPAIDKTVECAGFKIKEVNRVNPVSVDFGGKGINVSRAVKKLGLETQAIGIGFDKAKEICKFLEGEGIEAEFAAQRSSLRTNLKIFDKATSDTVEINESASKVTKRTLGDFMKLFEKKLPLCDILVLAGSVPDGVPIDIYKTLCERAKASKPDIKVIIDASGEALRLGAEAKPYMIKPNIEELTNTWGCRLDTYTEIKEATRRIIAEWGVDVILLSMGAKGAMIIDKDRHYLQDAVKVEVKSAQGAGDAMVAGACKAIAEGASLYKTLVYGVCSAAGAVSQNGTAFCCKEFFDEKVAGILGK